ncbi:serine protease [Streptomyces phyllanthi]|uniref:Serine protease n=1 Tax=Streptomyces phyllanthi TaxID=1803180 RepID=A0A5N8W2R7_9ACTN|nr:serine protease [Streptomyces phyllanthi]MPY41793.1 serine protease [Streptomyces phyllanthi]
MDSQDQGQRGPGQQVVELRTDDADDLDALYRELRGMRGLTLEAVPAPIAAGDQGSGMDLLIVALSSGAVTSFIDLLRSIVESRGQKTTLKVQRGSDSIEISADSLEETLPLLRELLRGP